MEEGWATCVRVRSWTDVTVWDRLGECVILYSCVYSHVIEGVSLFALCVCLSRPGVDVTSPHCGDTDGRRVIVCSCPWNAVADSWFCLVFVCSGAPTSSINKLPSPQTRSTWARWPCSHTIHSRTLGLFLYVLVSCLGVFKVCSSLVSWGLLVCRGFVVRRSTCYPRHKNVRIVYYEEIKWELNRRLVYIWGLRKRKKKNKK
jgi:hypothetical protein